MRIRQGTSADIPRTVEIWRAAVDATHGFLTSQDRAALDIAVSEMLAQARPWIVEDKAGPQGFMLLDGNTIEALFVDPHMHGRGFGTALVTHAAELADGPLQVDANEQADNALPFYEARGFVRIGRSDVDSDGRPYPLIHLRRSMPGPA